MGIQHDAHERGAAPWETPDEDERRVFRKVICQGQALIGWAQIELHPPVTMAFLGALHSTHAQVEQWGRAEENAAQQQARSEVPHGGWACMSASFSQINDMKQFLGAAEEAGGWNVKPW